jgi:hypothetical protein
VVGEIRARTGRLAVRKAGEELQPGQRAHGEAISEILVLGPGSTLHRHRDVDDILPDLPNRLVPEPEFLHGTRGEVVGDDIARGDQASRELLAGIGLQIQGYAALAAVAVGEVAAPVDTRDAVLVGAAAAQRIHPPTTFDLDDVRAVIGEQLRREGAGADPGEIGDADPVKGQAVQLTTPDFSNAARAAGP